MIAEPWSWRCAYCLQPAVCVAINSGNRIGACAQHGDVAMAELFRIRGEINAADRREMEE